MSELDLLVARRGTDPAGETCAHALRDLLGAPVAGVERGELWRFELAPAASGDPAAVRIAVERAAMRAGRYVNSNRDTCRWITGAVPYPADAPPLGVAVDVWVCDGDGRDAAALAYFRAQAGDVVRGVRRGTWWRLWMQEGPADAARERAWDLACTRSRTHGLLFNPQAQNAEILAVVPGPGIKEIR